MHINLFTLIARIKFTPSLSADLEFEIDIAGTHYGYEI